jgi:uncharacterized protein
MICSMWISRDIASVLQRAAAERPVLVLTGIRQTGKTALARHSFPDYRYVTLDLPSIAEQAERDPAAFLTQFPAPVIIDEVQYAPALFRHLKAVVDSDRAPGQFILSGSQRFGLMRSVSESLAGRAQIFEIEGLTQREIDRVAPDMAIEERMLRGGFPELYANPNLNPAMWMQSYVSTFLERDLRALLNVIQLRDYERFMRALALRGGNLLNQTEVGRDVGVATSTVSNWLSALQAAGVLHLLEPWFGNKTKQLVKMPKIYFSDIGLQVYLCGARSAADLSNSPMIGAFWETLCHSELRRAQLLEYGSVSLNFWRDRNREVDFLINRAGRFSLFECKWREQPDQRDARALLAVIEELGEAQVDQASIICRTAHPYPITTKIQAQNLKEIIGRQAESPK